MSLHDRSGSLLDRPLVRLLLAAALLASIAAGVMGVRYARSGSGQGGPVDVSKAPTSLVTEGPAHEAGIGALDDQAPVIGQPAPDFALKDSSGNVVKLSQLRGSVVWVNFWATWCEPCKQELPAIQKLYDEKRADGLQVVEVNWQDSPQSASEFWDSMQLSLPMVLDRNGDVFDQYKLRGLPDSFFVDREGKVAAMYFGYLSDSRMREKLSTAGLP